MADDVHVHQAPESGRGGGGFGAVAAIIAVVALLLVMWFIFGGGGGDSSTVEVPEQINVDVNAPSGGGEGS